MYDKGFFLGPSRQTGTGTSMKVLSPASTFFGSVWADKRKVFNPNH
jgi:hypothetical protein